MEVDSDDDKNVSKSKSNEERMKIWPQVSVVNMLISLKRIVLKNVFSDFGHFNIMFRKYDPR